MEVLLNGYSGKFMFDEQRYQQEPRISICENVHAKIA
jgi:hypothetical protein